MTHPLRFLSVALGIVLSISPSAWWQTSPSNPDLAAHLTVLRRNLREGSHFRVKVEIENVSNHVVLVGRDLNLSDNMPFRVQIRLEDSAGHQFIPYNGLVVDFLVLPDLQVENGLLVWRLPLYPHTILGTYFTLDLKDTPPGTYKLRGTYIVGRPQHEETQLERALLASKVSIFQGAVETNSIQLNILPKR